MISEDMYVCCVNVAHLVDTAQAVARLIKAGGDVDMDTEPPSPRLYRLLAHKFKVTRGPSLRSV